MCPIPSVDLCTIWPITIALTRPRIHIEEVAILKTPPYYEVPATTDPNNEGPALLNIFCNLLLAQHRRNSVIGYRRTCHVTQDILDAAAFTIIVVPVVASTAGIVAAVF
jgi:hypothetical protein